MTQYLIQPGSLKGSITAPPSKSHTLRAILFASMAKGKSVIKNYLDSPDVLSMIKACTQLGADIRKTQNTLEIVGVDAKPKSPETVIDAGNSGQVLRFIGAMGALTDGLMAITGDHSIQTNRPIQPLIEALTQLGATPITPIPSEKNTLPFQLRGPICAGKVRLNGEDSQPVSALLMVSAFLTGTTHIEVENPGEKPWVELTLSWLEKLGIPYTQKEYSFYTVEGGSSVNGFEYTVPGDFSSIAYPLVAALITHSEITIENVDLQDSQGDKKVIDLLIEMGANIRSSNNALHIKPSPPLTGRTIDVNDFIDALPILAVVGCYASGEMHLVNAGIARKKESNRISTIRCELNKLGGKIKEEEDGLYIKPSLLSGGVVQSHDDHRIALSLAVAACTASSKTLINGVECINKSYPNFIDDMKKLGCDIEKRK